MVKDWFTLGPLPESKRMSLQMRIVGLRGLSFVMCHSELILRCRGGFSLSRAWRTQCPGTTQPLATAAGDLDHLSSSGTLFFAI